MKLILMRHTQAEWSFRIEDHQRALSEDGRAEAGRLGQWLAENHHPSSHSLISGAKTSTGRIIDFITSDDLLK